MVGAGIAREPTPAGVFAGTARSYTWHALRKFPSLDPPLSAVSHARPQRSGTVLAYVPATAVIRHPSDAGTDTSREWGSHMSLFRQSTVMGLIAGMLLVLGMVAMSPEHAGLFFNIPGLLVVIGGTFAATLVSRPLHDVRAVLREWPALLRDEQPTAVAEMNQLLRFAEWYRLGNLRAAEHELTQVVQPFLYAGLRLLVDGCQPQDLSKSLQWRMSGLRAREQGQAQILRTMAVFAPAFGMLGTLFGLIHMLSGLGESGLDEIGSSMAFAMITTLYGIVAANLFFKPLAIKLERRTHQRLLQMGMLMEGVLMVYEKRHPTLIRETLEAFELHREATAPAAQVLTLVRA